MWGRIAGALVKIRVYLNSNICSTPAVRMEKVGSSKVYLTVVSAKQQSEIVLKLLIAFGLVSPAMGNSHHAKGNEAGEGEKIHSLGAFLAPALQGILSSSHKFKGPVMREPGRGPASSENQYGLPSIPSILLGSAYLGMGSNLAPSSESSCHFFHVLAWLSPSRVSRRVSFAQREPFSLGFSEREAVFQLNSKQLDSREKNISSCPLCLSSSGSQCFSTLLSFNSHSYWALSNSQNAGLFGSGVSTVKTRRKTAEGKVLIFAKL